MAYRIIEGSVKHTLGDAEQEHPELILLCAGRLRIGDEHFQAPVAVSCWYEDLHLDNAQALAIADLPLPDRSVVPDELTLQLVADAFFSEHASDGYRHAVIKVVQYRLQNARLAPASDDRPKAIADQALQLMAAHLDQPLSLNQLATELQCTAASLRAAFRAAGYRAPSRELTRIRVERACQLLAENELSISQVARAVGYGSVAALSHLFHKQMKCSPSAYRKRCLWVT